MADGPASDAQQHEDRQGGREHEPGDGRLTVGMTMAAVNSGPMAEPVLPPTWKVDCAVPKRPPEAMRATREASGWKVAEPIPTTAAANSNIG